MSAFADMGPKLARYYWPELLPSREERLGEAPWDEKSLSRRIVMFQPIELARRPCALGDMKSIFQFFAQAGKRAVRDPAIDHHMASFHTAAEELDAALGRRCGADELVPLVSEVLRCQTRLLGALSGEVAPDVSAENVRTLRNQSRP
ncbi:hypothetical protein [Sphingopyxis sp. 550A]